MPKDRRGGRSLTKNPYNDYDVIGTANNGTIKVLKAKPGFVLAGLNYRFQWYIISEGISIGAAVIFLLAYVLYAEVLRENAYLSRTIEIQENQKVIDTGLYGIVRHPMYSVTLVLFLAMPWVLGSVFSFFVFLVYPFLIAKRIKNEEMVLEQGLKGYKEYKQKVKYRLIPFIW